MITATKYVALILLVIVALSIVDFRYTAARESAMQDGEIQAGGMLFQMRPLIIMVSYVILLWIGYSIQRERVDTAFSLILLILGVVASLFISSPPSRLGFFGLAISLPIGFYQYSIKVAGSSLALSLHASAFFGALGALQLIRIMLARGRSKQSASNRKP